MADQLSQYLVQFEAIVGLYRHWAEQRCDPQALMSVFEQSLRGKPDRLRDHLLQATPASVFDAYNVMTDFATHRMRSPRGAFDLLERINAGFQKAFRLTTLTPLMRSPFVTQPCRQVSDRPSRAPKTRTAFLRRNPPHRTLARPSAGCTSTGGFWLYPSFPNGLST